MGRLSLVEAIEWTESVDDALKWHLGSNHYPPVPSTMVAVCKEVILWCNEDGDPNHEFALPNDIQYKGATTAPAWAIVDWLHLDDFLD